MTMRAGFAGVSAALERHLAAMYALPDWTSAVPVFCRTVDDFIQAGGSAVRFMVLLLHVGQDRAARNAQPPARVGSGRTPPPMVWELHYLLAARADDALTAQSLLAHAARHLHRQPVVAPTGGLEAPDALAFTPVAYPIAETVSLWQALGQRLQPCLVYRARWADAPVVSGVDEGLLPVIERQRDPRPG